MHYIAYTHPEKTSIYTSSELVSFTSNRTRVVLFFYKCTVKKKIFVITKLMFSHFLLDNYLLLYYYPRVSCTLMVIINVRLLCVRGKLNCRNFIPHPPPPNPSRKYVQGLTVEHENHDAIVKGYEVKIRSCFVL